MCVCLVYLGVCTCVTKSFFLQEIYELGSSEQGEVTVENGSTSEQSTMETSNKETDNKVKSLVSHLALLSYSTVSCDELNTRPLFLIDINVQICCPNCFRNFHCLRVIVHVHSSPVCLSPSLYKYRVHKTFLHITFS